MAPDEKKPIGPCPHCHAIPGAVDERGRPERHTIKNDGTPCPWKGQVA